MKRLLDPRVLLAVASLAAVALLALRDAADPGPGPLHPVHARVPELAGRAGCSGCHGAENAPEAMGAACLECHARIAAQIDRAAGLHGALVEDARDCAGCHGEHHGGALRLAGDAAFERAGFAGAAGFVHDGLGFGLIGRHLALACDACHAHAEADVLGEGQTRFLGLDQSCTACHEDPHAGDMGPGCAECHGQERPFPEVARFQHTSAFPLDAPHDGLACATCHAQGTAHGITALAARGEAAARECADCHQAGHSAGFLARVEPGCADCHGSATSFAAADLELTARHHGASGFALEASHARVDCAGCHGDGVTFEERFPGRPQQACAACHDGPHGGQFAPAPGAASDCAACHDVEGFAPSGFDAADHRAAGFPLDGAHSGLDCGVCHDAPEPDAPARFRGTPRSCVACHDDVHRGLLAEVAPLTAAAAASLALGAGTDCAACHGTAAFRPALEGAFDHGAATGFALTGAHGAADCAACHGPAPDGARSFGLVSRHLPGDASRCVTCHEDPHGDRFDALGETARLDCGRCHTTTSFLDVAPRHFDHGAATGFPLVGAHAQTGCVRCHVPEEGSGRRLGRVAAAFPGPPERCATCHDDPHRGIFDGDHCPGALDGAVGCARCHTPRSFRRADPFDHGRWTGWALEGAHAELGCASCHAPVPPGPLGRTSAPAAGTSCADCHADPHLGQFAEGGAAVDCARCHDAALGFAEVDFDHDAARFRLDARHAALDCSACHRTAATTDGREAVRYRPLGRECVDCHDPVRGQGDGR